MVKYFLGYLKDCISTIQFTAALKIGMFAKKNGVVVMDIYLINTDPTKE